MLPQLFIFHTAGGKPVLFESVMEKASLLCNILQHGKVGVICSQR